MNLFVGFDNGVCFLAILRLKCYKKKQTGFFFYNDTVQNHYGTNQQFRPTLQPWVQLGKFLKKRYSVIKLQMHQRLPEIEDAEVKGAATGVMLVAVENDGDAPNASVEPN